MTTTNKQIAIEKAGHQMNAIQAFIILGTTLDRSFMTAMCIIDEIVTVL